MFNESSNVTYNILAYPVTFIIRQQNHSYEGHFNLTLFATYPKINSPYSHMGDVY